MGSDGCDLSVMRLVLIAAELRTYATILRRWGGDPKCDAVQHVIDGLMVQADRLADKWDDGGCVGEESRDGK
jgi:hypothetical protein